MHHDKAIQKRLATLAAALVTLGSFPGPSSAQAFCDQLNTIVAAVPQFVSLRVEAEGMQFHGSLLLEGAVQCEIRNKSDFDENWQTINEKWNYECLWENRTERALPALKALVGQCLPDAAYSDGTPLGEKFPNFVGGVFRIDEISIVTDYNKDTNQLWLTVLPAGVEQ